MALRIVLYCTHWYSVWLKHLVQPVASFVTFKFRLKMSVSPLHLEFLLCMEYSRNCFELYRSRKNTNFWSVWSVLSAWLLYLGQIFYLFKLNISACRPFFVFLTLSQTSPSFYVSAVQRFLFFPTQISIFESLLFCRLQMLWIWTTLKFCCLVKS